ncbi:hypothetical protein COV18_00515 [Candidatus Woesearchaeota archaeon CG10_big_fil_rev_8_21_14_0_10_37_12]|nr:MAG: hypothetical protein COV18_00515 [Candidatus Woesearchaeota archaeon CG10_big_fil_rev_8_21_14_0_10_37_12]
MKFKVHERQHPNKLKYSSTDFDFAKKFAVNLEKELGQFVKAIILFGSAARGEQSALGVTDIDILIIIDDLTNVLSKEVIQAYRVITENTAAQVSKRLHITTLKLTTYWEHVRNGDPLIINMLRDGISLHDAGIFAPVQELLAQGKVRPSKESIWMYSARAPATIHNADGHILQATVDLYWAVVDSAHAALMNLGHVPPTPAHLADMIEKHLVKQKIVPAKYAATMDKFYQLQKKITYRQIQVITGRQYDEYKQHAQEFVKTMQKIAETRH